MFESEILMQIESGGIEVLAPQQRRGLVLFKLPVGDLWNMFFTISLHLKTSIGHADPKPRKHEQCTLTVSAFPSPAAIWKGVQPSYHVHNGNLPSLPALLLFLFFLSGRRNGGG